MGRPTNVSARRAQVADAFIGLLADASFEDITVVAMAKAAGLRPGLVHHYFASKEEVLAVAVERMAIQLEVRLAERLRRVGDDPRARIDAFIDAWLALDGSADRRAAFAWAAIGDEARRRLDVRAIYSTAIGRGVDRLAEDVARLVPPRKRRARSIAEAIMVAIEGALRVGAGGGLEAGTAAPLARRVAAALLNDAAVRP
ncbi:MAG TPA: TetR/AcrR family transcriptional regulator [Polyangiaceae bacterium]|nr:TetR/AcrR family transcriptional regulator [Polyangiaceae bacterium]